MMINTDTIISISEANQNFSKVAIVIEFSKIPESDEVADKAAVSIAKKLINVKK